MILVLALSACSTTEPLRPEGMRRSKSPPTAGTFGPPVEHTTVREPAAIGPEPPPRSDQRPPMSSRS